jgi:hypothetical protein
VVKFQTIQVRLLMPAIFRRQIQMGRLQIDAICKPEFVYTADDVDHRLSRLPETLQDTYAEIFEVISRYPPDSREVTEKALKWVLCAQ